MKEEILEKIKHEIRILDIHFVDEEVYMRGATRALELAGDGWISVEDRLPEDSNDVLMCLKVVYATQPKIIQGYYHAHSWKDIRGETEWAVTHWQPLPSPPSNK